MSGRSRTFAPASLAPLKHRDFALTVAASFVSSVGSFMQSVALGVYLTVTTHNAIWLGLITLALWLPSLVASPFGGIVADRWDRRRFIQANNLIMAASASALAYAGVTHHLSPTLACALAIVEGFASAATWPAYQSLLPDLVARDEVLAAVSLSSAQFNLGRVVGPLLAGVALSLGSPALCFIANAGTFLFVATVFVFVRVPVSEARRDRVAWVAELRAGANQAWAVKGCRYPILTVIAVAFTIGPFISLVPAMAIDVLHAGRLGTPWLVTAQGVGAVVAALTLPNLARRTSRSLVLRLSLSTVVVAMAAYGLSPSLALAGASLMFLGAGYIGVMTGLNTNVQLHAPTRERSRILSLYTMSLSISYPIGTFVQSALARGVGLREVTVGAALFGATGLGVAAWRAPGYWGVFVAPGTPTQLLAD